MAYKNHYKAQIIILIWILSIHAPPLIAQQDSVPNKKVISLFKIEASGAYLWPIHSNRQIKTVMAYAMAGKQFFEKVHLGLYSGIITAYAWGNIIRLNDHFEEVTLENSAFGAGLLFLLRFDPVVVKRISIGLDMGGAGLIYTEDFPAGGDFYNLMWLIGPTLTYQIKNHYSIGIGYRWIHVSNGQGLGAHNPSYEGEGVWVSYGRYF